MICLCFQLVGMVEKYLVFCLVTSAAGLVDFRLLVFVLLRVGAQFFGESVVVGEPEFSALHHDGTAGETQKK